MSTVDIRVGDCRTLLAAMPDQSVNCCVTSPPYFGLRDYGTAKWEGGDAACDHIEMAIGMSEKNTLGPDKHLPATNAANVGRARQYCHTCAKCGARRVDSQIGLEQTPDEYVAKMVGVFREVRRVLRDDGTLWLNLGDSYAGSSIAGAPRVGIVPGEGGKIQGRNRNGLGSVDGLKPKDLIGIPWRVAFALQADGWYLRQDIIWHKPNPMPESVKDRCTKAHEYIFMMSKSARYYYDHEAIKNPPSEALLKQVREGYAGTDTKDYGSGAAQSASGTKARIIERAREKLRCHARTHEGFRDKWGAPTRDEQMALGSNRRSVWSVATKPFKGAHFATFPPDLIEPCILAGCPAGGTVLDPFGGAGTTGLVAKQHGRNAILLELNPEYAAMARERIDAPPAPKRKPKPANDNKTPDLFGVAA